MPDFTLSAVAYRNGNEWSKPYPNPFLGRSVIHPNQHGWTEFAWELGGFPEAGAALMCAEVFPNDPNWTGSIEAVVCLSQGHRRECASYLIGPGLESRIGIGFVSDGSDYRLSISVRLLNPKDYQGSSLTIFPLSYVNPAPETREPTLYALSQGWGPALISCNQGGLMNRLISLLSCVYVARRTRRDVYVWWGQNQHCAAAMHDLFQVYPASPARRADVAIYEGEGKGTLQTQGEHHDVLVHTVTTIRGDHPHNIGALGDYFPVLSYSDAVVRSLARYTDLNLSRTVAIHVRQPYSNGFFAELENSKFGFGYEVFADMIRLVRRSYPWVERVLICSNDRAAEERAVSEFDGFVIRNQKQSYDNANDSKAVQEALVDFELMRRCPVIMSQMNSAFGLMAHICGAGLLYLMTNDTTDEAFRFEILRHGTRTGTLTCTRESGGDGLLDPLAAHD